MKQVERERGMSDPEESPLLARSGGSLRNGGVINTGTMEGGVKKKGTG